MKKKHLPLMGVGPIYVAIIIILTIAGVLATVFNIIGRITYSYFYFPVAVMGIALILLGIFIWCSANFKSKLDKNIKSNNLITTGVYAYVRNPVFFAFMMMCTGVLLLVNNLWLLILPIVFFGLFLRCL